MTISKETKILSIILSALFILFLFLIGYMISPYQANKTLNNSSSPSSPIAPVKEEIKLTEPGGKWVKEKYPTWSNEICNKVAVGKISLGMTTEQVKFSWGKPYKINTSIGAWGEHQQWVMFDSVENVYLYFENDILTSAQDTTTTQ